MPELDAALLSPRAREIHAADPGAYSRLVVTGAAPSRARGLLAGVTPDQLLSVPVKDRAAADALLAGLWLWHDALDESHAISQGIETPAGSFWHAIMHRREGDFSNAKYWYARCHNHPALPDDPGSLVDLVARVHRDPAHPEHARAVELQRQEWGALFEHCVRAAAGG
jgi:hypothetical protein